MYEEAYGSYGIVCIAREENGRKICDKDAVIGFDDFGEADEFADRHGGRLVVLYRKSRCDFWELNGMATQPFKISAEDFGEGFTAWSYDQRNEWFKEMKDSLKERLDYMDADQIEEWYDSFNEIWEGFDNLYNGEMILLNNGVFDSIIKEFALRRSYNSETYIIGVMDEQDL